MKPRQTLLLGLIVALLIAGIVLYNKLWIPHKEKAKLEKVFPALLQEEPLKIEISRGNYKDELARKGDDEWVVASEDDYPADEEGIRECLEMIKNLDTANLVSSDPDKQDRFEISDEKGIRVKILASGDKPLADFLIGKRGPTYRSYYFRETGHNNIYLAYENLLDSFNREHSTWKDKTIFDFPSEDARELNIKSDEGSIKLVKNLEEDAWGLVEGEERVKAKKWTVNDMVSSLAKLKTQEFPEEKDMKETGLEAPEKQVSVKLADGTEYTLLVGDEKESSGKLYVKRADSPTIFLIGSYQAKKFFKKKDDLKETEKEEAEEESFLPPPDLEKD
jgi:hypothetical protein